MQTILSDRTSRRIVPALFKSRAFWHFAGAHNADVGGGRWNDGTKYLAKRGVENHVIDPFNRADKHNLAAMRDAVGSQTATLSNVLNVIDCPDARRAAINEACSLVHRRLGRVLVTVYEGDRSGVGRPTRDGWQANRRLADWIEEIESLPAVGCVSRKGSVLIIRPRWCVQTNRESPRPRS